MKEKLIGIFESYRGTKWGKAAETIGDKVIEVVDRESSKAEARIQELEDILSAVLNDSGFKNLDDKLQEKIWEKM